VGRDIQRNTYGYKCDFNGLEEFADRLANSGKYSEENINLIIKNPLIFHKGAYNVCTLT